MNTACLSIYLGVLSLLWAMFYSFQSISLTSSWLNLFLSILFFLMLSFWFSVNWIFKMWNFWKYCLMSFSKFILLCKAHHNLVLEYLYLPKKFPCVNCSQSLLSPLYPRKPLICSLPPHFFLFWTYKQVLMFI